MQNIRLSALKALRAHRAAVNTIREILAEKEESDGRFVPSQVMLPTYRAAADRHLAAYQNARFQAAL